MNAHSHRSTRRPARFLALLVGTAFAALLVAPTAANAGETTATFSIANGGITISQAGDGDLGSGTPGQTTTALLGAVTVTDHQASLTGAWTATVSSSDFTTVNNTTAETVPATAVSYYSGVLTDSTGGGVFTPGQAAIGDAKPLGSAQTSFSHAGGVGDNSAVWNPTILVAVPAQAVAGIYSGTITNSAA